MTARSLVWEAPPLTWVHVQEGEAGDHGNQVSGDLGLSYSTGIEHTERMDDKWPCEDKISSLVAKQTGEGVSADLDPSKLSEQIVCW